MDDEAVGDAAPGGATSRAAVELRERRRDRWRLRQAVPIALGVAAGFVLAEASLGILFRLRNVLVLLLVSLFLSFAIEPGVQWLENRGVRRGLGTALVYLGFLALGAGFVLAVSGLVTEQVTALADAAPRLVDDLAAQADRLPDDVEVPVRRWLEEQSATLGDRLSSMAGDVGRTALGVGSTIVGGLFAALTVAFITFYIVADGPRLRSQLLRRLEPARQRELLHLWELAILKTGGYVYSRVVLAVVSSVVHIVAFTVLDLPYAAALGVWMGIVSSLIPVVGTYIAGAVPVVVAIAEPGVSVLWILVVITVYQQLENYLVQPRISQHALSLHPAVAFIAVLVGAALLGAVGALLALPAAAIVASLVTIHANEHEVMDHGLTNGPRRPPDPGPRT